MEPDKECLKLFEFGSTVVQARYTYVSKEYLIMNWDEGGDEWKAYEWAIGWWNWEKGNDFFDMIENGDPDGKQVKEPVMITVGQAFLGALGSVNLHFVSNGEVVQDTTAYDTNGSAAPLFLNYLPVAIDLSDIEVTGDDEESFMEPDKECLKKFEFGSTVVEARYTYVSKDYLIMNWDDGHDEWKEYEWAIGWWNWEKGNDFFDMIENGDPDGKQIKTPLEVAAGQAYLGALGSLNLHFNFPDPTNLPVRK